MLLLVTAVAKGLTLSSPALPEPIDPADHSLLFAVAYSVDDGVTIDNHVRIGRATFTGGSTNPAYDGTARLVFWDYDGSQNYDSNFGALNHPTAPDGHDPSCAPNPFEYIGNAVTFDSASPSAVDVHYTYSDVTGILDIYIDEVQIHRWVLRERETEFFELGADFHWLDSNVRNNAFTDDVTGVHSTTSLSYVNSVGMAFLSDDFNTTVNVDVHNLAASYDFRGYQSTGNDDGLNSHPWAWVDSGFSVPSPSTLSNPHADIIAIATPTSHYSTAFGIWTYQSVFLMHGGGFTGGAAPCFNPTAGNPVGSGGHVRTLWGVWNDSTTVPYVIPRGIGIEYSPENDNRPILSVFRFDAQ